MVYSRRHGPINTLPPDLGGFTPLEEIGRGGMGVVYRAEDSAGCQVALKVLPSFAGVDTEAVERFRREAEAAGRLCHPGIVPITSVGEEEGVYYFAMQLVEGPSLQDLIDSLSEDDPAELRGSLAEETAIDQVYPGLVDAGGSESDHRYARSCAGLASEVCSALATAHEGLVIHRDIKPSNIILDRKGRPMLVDFGLARDLLTTGGLTRTGDAVGTPSYMAPEQARGGEEVDGRVDVYGLGATLYEMLALRPPFDGPHPGEIMRRILDEEPTQLRELNPALPVDLASIVHRCLEKDPDRRYPSMEALKRDLDAFLAGQPVSARGLTADQRLGRWFQRHRRAALVYAGSCAVILFAAAASSLVSSGRTQRRANEALEQARVHLEDGRPDLMQEAYGRARVLLGEDSVWEARRDHARELFEEYYRAEQFELLQEILDPIPPERRSSEVRDMLVKLHGTGSLQVLGIESGSRAAITIRRATDREWQPFEGGILPGGEYLLQVERPGLATARQRVEVLRDHTVSVEVPALSRSQVPKGMVMATGADPTETFAIDRTELTAAAYVAFLRGLDNAQLRKEMLPAGWSGPFPPDGPEYPVRGLSFRQARTLAAHLRRHLPSPREYRIGAYGGLESLPYPWGKTFDASRVAANPDRLGSPLAADSLGSGASPLGLVHVLGNVAEILSADPQGTMVLAGGHYLSEPRGEAFGAEELEGPDHSRPYAGVRLARFLFPRRPTAPAATTPGVRLVRWQLDEVGNLSVHAADGAPETIAGFSRINRRSGRQGLLPASGLRGFRDSYLMRLPLWNAAEQIVAHELILPAGCAADDVAPPPDLMFRRPGALHLVWELPAGPLANLPVLIRFRRDGMLSESWPANQPVEQAVDRFFNALTEGRELDSLLAEEFVMQPYGWTRAQLLGREPRGKHRELFSRWRVVDVTAVGSVVAAEVRVDWRPEGRGGEVQTVPDWPLMVYLRAGAREGYQLLRVEPADRPDRGEVQGGVYRHDALKVEVGPQAGTAIVRRDQQAPVDLQVTCFPADDDVPPGVEFNLLGYAAGPGGESAARIQHLLTDGDVSGRPGEFETGPRQQFVGGGDGTMGHLGRNKEWRFWDVSRKEYSRERWTLLEIGQRHFVLRSRATGGTRQEADQRFQAAQSWFAAMARAVRIR